MKSRWLVVAPWYGCGIAQARLDFPKPPICPLCGINLRLGFDFLVGVALLIFLMWLLYRIEEASLPVIAENLFAAVIAGFVLLLFLRFFATGA